MALIKSIQRPDGSTYEYHTITMINLPAFFKGIGWGEGLVKMDSFVSKQAYQDGFSPVLQNEFPIPFTAFPSIVWDTEAALLDWAYQSLKEFFTPFADGENDLVPNPEPVPEETPAE